MATKINPGRARVTAKVWTSEMTLELTGCAVSESAGLAIYQIATGGKTDLVQGLKTLRALDKARGEIERGERDFSRLLDDIEATLTIKE